jgi:hypothetical protein
MGAFSLFFSFLGGLTNLEIANFFIGAFGDIVALDGVQFAACFARHLDMLSGVSYKPNTGNWQL